MTRVKICGITTLDDALLAVDLGAHALGFVLYRHSARYIAPDGIRNITAALPPFVVTVGVFVNEAVEEMETLRRYCGLDRIQAHYDDPDRYESLPLHAIAGYRIKDAADIERARKTAAFPLLDCHHDRLYGGTGSRFDWSLAASFGRPFVLAGGINADSLGDALALKPYAVDIASGVEQSPGKKDRKKMFDLFRRLRENQHYMKETEYES